MPRLAVASPEQIQQIYRESHALWGAGLSCDDYVALWNDISKTPWAEKHARFYVWVDGRDRVLSSLKLYRPLVRLAGQTSRAGVLGAVFTPRSLRRCGHASALMRAVLERSRARGDRLALLFSDIGTAYYASLGFRALPADEQVGTLHRSWRAGPRSWSLRPASPDDHESIREAHQGFCAQRPIAIIRDAAHWEFLWARSRSFFARLRRPGVLYRCQVAEERRRFAGYLIAVEGRGEWHVREVGAVDGDPRGMAAILRLGAEQARAAGLRRFYGWLPEEVIDRLPDWGLRRRRRRGALPMVLPLAEALDLARLDAPGAAYLPYQDQF